MSQLKNILGPMRAPFLVLTPACILLGLGTAVWTSGQINIFYFILLLIGAVSAHISVNAFNEYFDFKSGLDLHTERTPFSGGSGTLPENPDMVRSTLITAIITFAVTGVIGLYFLFNIGVSLLPIGIVGLILLVVYTPYVAHSPYLSLLSPGFGFGPLMVMGTDFVLTGSYSWAAFAASLIPFFLVNNLLLLNQFPDVEADKSIGRKNLPIVLGKSTSSKVYGISLLCAYLSLALCVFIGLLPKASLIGLISIVIAVPVAIGVIKHAENMEKLIPIMGLNVILNLVTPVLVAVGLFIG